jgi:hypothetical protein
VPLFRLTLLSLLLLLLLLLNPGLLAIPQVVLPPQRLC